jgi:hypothetical protein
MLSEDFIEDEQNSVNVQQPEYNRVYNIPEYDISSLNPEDVPLIGIIGESMFGKTTLLLDLVEQLYSYFLFGFFFCPTRISDEKLQKAFMETLTWDDFNIPMLATLFEYQRCVRQMVDGDKSRVPWTFIFSDDCGFDVSVLKHKQVVNLAQNGRHYHMFGCLNLQQIKAISPGVRQNLKMIIALNTTNGQRIEDLWTEFFSGLSWTKQEFKDVFEQLTEDYRVLILDKSKAKITSDPEKCVFSYRARLHFPKRHRMGHPLFWEFDRYYAKRNDPLALQRFLFPQRETNQRRKPRTRAQIVKRQIQQIEDVDEREEF